VAVTGQPRFRSVQSRIWGVICEGHDHPPSCPLLWRPSAGLRSISRPGRWQPSTLHPSAPAPLAMGERTGRAGGPMPAADQTGQHRRQRSPPRGKPGFLGRIRPDSASISVNPPNLQAGGWRMPLGRGPILPASDINGKQRSNGRAADGRAARIKYEATAGLPRLAAGAACPRCPSAAWQLNL